MTEDKLAFIIGIIVIPITRIYSFLEEDAYLQLK